MKGKREENDSSLLYNYESYDKYKEAQIKGFRKKEGVTWYNGKLLRTVLAPYIFNYNRSVKFGLCHGTRNGGEQGALKRGFLECGADWVHVLGTEIAPEAEMKYPNTIHWDFHDVKDSWINNVDFIYSNAFDHSYKPDECLKSWLSCLNEKGLCIVEWGSGYTKGSTVQDPFCATKEFIIEMFEFCGAEVVDILDRSKIHKPRYYFIVKRR
jgi:hypothetical protein